MAIAYLRRIELLRQLPARELKRVLSISQKRDFPQGTKIFGKAEVAESMFVVIRGRIKIFSQSAGRKRKTFAYLGPGDFFGEMAVLEGVVRSASAQAVEDSKLLIIHKRDFQRLLTADPKLCYYLLITVSRRLRRANEEIEGLLFKNILGRVAKVLYDLAGPAAAKSLGPIPLKRKFTHQELADLVGTTREPLSRALATLRRADLVETREGAVMLTDPRKLEDLIRTAEQAD